MSAEVTNFKNLFVPINEAHDRAVDSHRKAVTDAIECGKMLIEAKAAVPHGTFSAYLETEFSGSQRTAQRFMQISKHVQSLPAREATRVADLSIREAVKAVSNLSRKAKAVPDADRLKVLGKVLKHDVSFERAKADIDAVTNAKHSERPQVEHEVVEAPPIRSIAEHNRLLDEIIAGNPKLAKLKADIDAKQLRLEELETEFNQTEQDIRLIHDAMMADAHRALNKLDVDADTDVDDEWEVAE